MGIIHTFFREKPFKFVTASGVFSKKRVDPGTRLLVESMVLPEQGFVLDVGCGYGAVAIAAAGFNPAIHVIMVDVNERALWLAKQNAQINAVTNTEVRQGYLYESVKNVKFDCILSNPPVSAGKDIVHGIIDGALNHLKRKAYLQMVFKSKIYGKRLRKTFENTFGNVEILARKSGYRVVKSEKQ